MSLTVLSTRQAQILRHQKYLLFLDFILNDTLGSRWAEISGTSGALSLHRAGRRGQAERKAEVTLVALPSDPSVLHRWETGIRKTERRAAGGACQYSVLLW